MGVNLSKTVEQMRRFGGDLQDIEVKEAVGGMPKSMGDSVSALANGSGGLVILGLSEKLGFMPAPGFRARPIYDALSELCADRLVPPVRAHIDVMEFEGAEVVVGEIPELSPQDKPCYVASKGMYAGSFIRVGDGDRLLTRYEIDRLSEERSQPKHDLGIVEGACLEDLDERLVGGLLARQREIHPRVFARLSDREALFALNVLGRSRDGEEGVTLAGLLALGTYPQHFYPRLTVSFACYPGTRRASETGVKFLDSQSMAGPIPAVLLDTMAAVRRNMRTGGRLQDGLRYDVPDYPLDAVRELVCNALMHRDYSPMGCGSQVQVNMYEDRLEVLSPGGLYGAVTVDSLGEVGASSTRNRYLSELLESTPYEGGGFVAENRGTGFQLVEEELRAADMEPPVIVDRPSLFSVTLRRRGSAAASLDEARDTGRQECRVRTEASGLSFPHRVDMAWHPSGSSLVVYETIRKMGEARPAEIASETRLPRSTVSYALKKLLEKGVIVVLDGSEAKNSPMRAYRLA